MNLWVKSLQKKEKDLCVPFFLLKRMKTSSMNEYVLGISFWGLDPDRTATFKEGAWSSFTQKNNSGTQSTLRNTEFQ